MRKPTRFRDILKIFAIYLLAIYAICACNPEKKIARQDNKAVSRVLAKRQLLDTVGREWIKLNPCANDSSVVYIKGDSTVLFDTVSTHSTDTLTNTKEVIKTVTKTVTKYDTVKIVVKDQQEINLLKGDLDKLTKAYIVVQQQTITAQEQADDNRKDKNMWMWIAIGLIVFIVGGGILKLTKVL